MRQRDASIFVQCFDEKPQFHEWKQSSCVTWNEIFSQFIFNFFCSFICFFVWLPRFCIVFFFKFCTFPSFLIHIRDLLVTNTYTFHSFFLFFLIKNSFSFCFAIHLSFYSKNLFPVFIFNLIYMVIALGRKQHIHRQALKENKWKSLLIDGGSVNPFKSNPA